MGDAGGPGQRPQRLAGENAGGLPGSRGPGKALVLEALARGCIAQDRLDEANGWLNRWIEIAPDDWYRASRAGRSSST